MPGHLEAACKDAFEKRQQRTAATSKTRVKLAKHRLQRCSSSDARLPDHRDELPGNHRGRHYLTTRPCLDRRAVGSHGRPGAILAFCRSGLGTTEEVFSMCDY